MPDANYVDLDGDHFSQVGKKERDAQALGERGLRLVELVLERLQTICILQEVLWILWSS